MSDDQIKELTRKLEEFITDVNKEMKTLSNMVFAIEGSIKTGIIHSAPCKFLEAHKEQASNKIKDIHNRIDAHKDECHSSKSVGANWGLIFTGICSLATLGTLFYMILKGQ